jgi:hypothetical protein
MGGNIALEIGEFTGIISPEFCQKISAFFCIGSAAETNIVSCCRQSFHDSCTDPACTAGHQNIATFHKKLLYISFGIYYWAKYIVKEKKSQAKSEKSSEKIRRFLLDFS